MAGQFGVIRTITGVVTWGVFNNSTRDDSASIASWKNELGATMEMKAYSVKHDQKFDFVIVKGGTIPEAGDKLTVPAGNYLVASVGDVQNNEKFTVGNISVTLEDAAVVYDVATQP